MRATSVFKHAPRLLRANALVILIVGFLLSSCQLEEEQVEPSRSTISKHMITIDDIPDIIPLLEKYDSKYSYLRTGTSPTARIDELDLDLQHILQVIDPDGKMTYNIAINHEFTDYDDYYFETLHISEKDDGTYL